MAHYQEAVTLLIGFVSAVEVFAVVSTQISGTFTQKQLRPYSDRPLFYLMGT